MSLYDFEPKWDSLFESYYRQVSEWQRAAPRDKVTLRVGVGKPPLWRAIDISPTGVETHCFAGRIGGVIIIDDIYEVVEHAGAESGALKPGGASSLSANTHNRQD